MNTDSTADVMKGLRAYLLGFAPMGGGDTLGARLSVVPEGSPARPNRLYIVNVPDVLVYPYGIMRWMDPETSGATRGNRMAGELETILYHRPRGKAQDLEHAADVYQQAMREFADATDGLVFSRAGRRNTLPPFQDPADREVVMIRLVNDLVVWPNFLTQYDTDTP